MIVCMDIHVRTCTCRGFFLIASLDSLYIGGYTIIVHLIHFFHNGIDGCREFNCFFLFPMQSHCNTHTYMEVQVSIIKHKTFLWKL